MANDNIIDLKGHELYLIERILNRQQSRDTNNHFKKTDITQLAGRYLFPTDLISSLEGKNLIYYSEEYVYITEYAKRCLDHKYKEERKLIIEHIIDNYVYAFLLFMHNRNEQVAMYHFPTIFIEYSQIHMTAVEGSENLYWNWFDEVSKYTIEPNAYGYILNDVGISRFNKLTMEREFSITQKNLEMQKLRGDVDKLSNDLTDYDNVKSRLKRTEIVAWVTGGLLLLKLILEYSGCKSA